MPDKTPPPGPLTGQLLLSHPVMRHDAFRRTVVLVAAQGRREGSMGVILNRPLGQTVASANPQFSAGAVVGKIPLYEGGPVAERQLLLAGWHWTEPERHFHLHFGLSKERAADIATSDPGIHLRAFLGHAGWSPGQLENELENQAWAVAPMDAELVDTEDGVALWHALLNKYHPSLRLLAEAPDEPEFN